MGCSEGATAVDPRESPSPAVASSSPLSVLAAAADLPDRPDGLSEVETITLVAALRSVPDPRQARGRRYSLQAVVMLALTGVMAGARSETALAQWAREGQHRSPGAGRCRRCGPSAGCCAPSISPRLGRRWRRG